MYRISYNFSDNTQKKTMEGKRDEFCLRKLASLKITTAAYQIPSK